MEKSDNTIRGQGHFEKATKTIMENSDKKIIVLSTISKTNSNDVEAMCKYFSDSNPVFGLCSILNTNMATFRMFLRDGLNKGGRLQRILLV